MNSPLAALRESIVTETAAANPDFQFLLAADQNGNLTADYYGAWEPRRTPDPRDTPFLTISHDGDRFLVSHYRWDERKQYKTLKGAAKYVDAELSRSCGRKREQKAKDCAERDFAEKSLLMLREFHERLTSNGIKAKLCLTADRYNHNHVSIDATRTQTSIDITVTRDYRFEMAFTYPRFYATPETAIDILSVLSKEKSA